MSKKSTNKEGYELLSDPSLNKGLAFSRRERKLLGLDGIIPWGIQTIEDQIMIARELYDKKSTPLEKYNFLQELKSHNEVIYYRFIITYIEEVLQYIYTPTVGDVANMFSHYYHNDKGLFLSKGIEIETTIKRWPYDDARISVITDGGRVLGLGDIGIGGMAIAIGKCVLYTIFGGIHPKKLIPVVLDIGTEKKSYNTPYYIGNKIPRISGGHYYKFLDDVVTSLRSHHPNILIQWEDFSKEHARSILDIYSSSLRSFNDDIEGTAAVCLAGILSSLRMRGDSLPNKKICIFGGGSAGIGIANILLDYSAHIGISREKALKSLYVVDREGLLVTGVGQNISQEQSIFARDKSEVPNRNLFLREVIEKFDISILIGVSTQSGAFDEGIIKTMMRNHSAPIIFPLSNPNSKSEATPDNIDEWSNGKAIVATGSPFDGRNHNLTPQCNNLYIFPAIGLMSAALLPKKITKRQFLIAAESLSKSKETLSGEIFPRIKRMREVIRGIAIDIGESAFKEGLTQCESIEERIDREMWFPNYEEILG